MSEELIKKIEENGLDIRDIIAPPPLSLKVEPLSESNSYLPGQINDDQDILKKAYFKFSKPGSDGLESYNNWIQNILPKQIAEENIKSGENIYRFSLSQIKKPVQMENGVDKKIYPVDIRATSLTYSSEIFINIEKYKVENGKLVTTGEIIKNKSIGKIPTMLGSVICNLHGLTDEELLNVGEEPYSSYGYFIIKGIERFLTMDEHLRTRRVINYIDKAKETICRITLKGFKSSSVIEIFSIRDTVRIFYTKFPHHESVGSFKKLDKEHMKKTLNIFQPFRIMQPDITIEEIMHYIFVHIKPEWGKLSRYALESTLIEYKSISDDYKYIIDNFKDSIKGSTFEDKKREFKNSFNIYFLDHMYGLSIKNKFYFLGYMIAKYIGMKIGKLEIDDRDDWANKYIQSPGKSIEKLFGIEWSSQVRKIKEEISKISEQKQNIDLISRKINTITSEVNTAFSRGIWKTNARGKIDEDNKTEQRKEIFSLAGFYAELTKVGPKSNTQSNKNDIREVKASQIGYICLHDTPEGQKCGLVKRLAVTAKISIEREEGEISHLIKKFVQEDWKENFTGVILNGKFMGWSEGTKLYEYFLRLRRNFTLPFDIMLGLDKDEKILNIYSDDGRLVRPLLIVNQETGNLLIDEKNLWGQPFKTLLEEGVIEYIDVWEQQYTLIAQYYDMIRFKDSSIKEYIDRKQELEQELDFAQNNVDNFYDKEGVKNQIVDKQKEYNDTQITINLLNEEKQKLNTQEIDWDDMEARTNRKRRMDAIKQSILELEERLRISDGELKDLQNKENNFLNRFENKQEDIIQEIQKEIDDINSLITDNRNRKYYTHCELYPDAILGIPLSLAPMANSQPGPRSTYQASMIKQSIGIFDRNHMLRMDKNSKVLSYPTLPLFQTNTSSLIGFDELPAGEEVVVAIMPYLGWNQEDGIILNRGAVERGLFTSKNYFTPEDKIITEGDFTEVFAGPVNVNENNREKFELIGEDGLPEVGRYIREDQAIINKVRTYPNGRKENVSVTIGPIHEGKIVRILRSKSYENEDIVKVKIEQVYIPGEGNRGTGDKFALRYSQKGTVTKILPEDEMPYVKGTNIRPDVIFNSHGIPSRKTIGMIIEILLSKVASLRGERVDATSFRKANIDEAIEYMKSRGLDPYGREVMINPVTGHEIETMIFMGPVYYQVLKHKANEKMQSRSTGHTQISTRQPTRSSPNAKNSGVRMGEQERNALLAHGAANVIRDKYCRLSDITTVQYCKKCGELADINIEEQRISCNICKDQAEFLKASIPYPTKIFMQMMRSVGVKINFSPDKLSVKTLKSSQDEDDLEIEDSDNDAVAVFEEDDMDDEE